MKTKVTQKGEPFPVKLKITIENVEELALFWHLYNTPRLPELLNNSTLYPLYYPGGRDVKIPNITLSCDYNTWDTLDEIYIHLDKSQKP